MGKCETSNTKTIAEARILASWVICVAYVANHTLSRRRVQGSSWTKFRVSRMCGSLPLQTSRQRWSGPKWYGVHHCSCTAPWWLWYLRCAAVWRTRVLITPLIDFFPRYMLSISQSVGSVKRRTTAAVATTKASVSTVESVHGQLPLQGKVATKPEERSQFPVGPLGGIKYIVS